MSIRDGVVLERDGAAYRVGTPEGEVRAILRGKVKRDDPRVVVGDRVTLDRSGDDLWAIAAVAPRRTLLERRVPEGRGARPVVANVDRVFVVTAIRDPQPIVSLLDRLLCVAEANDLAAEVVINKCDLAPCDELAARFRAIGYPVHRVSVKRGDGIAEMRAAVQGREIVMTGPSGAGKSSLLNALQPGLRLRTGEISERNRRGKNTTVGAVMLPLDGGGWLVDTPGFSEIGLWGLEPQHLAACFPEFRPFLGECRYGDCRHWKERDCAIARAVAAGTIAEDRLATYRQLLEELESAPKPWE
jgi:ribosome biogenesis GTPase